MMSVVVEFENNDESTSFVRNLNALSVARFPSLKKVCLMTFSWFRASSKWSTCTSAWINISKRPSSIERVHDDHQTSTCARRYESMHAWFTASRKAHRPRVFKVYAFTSRSNHLNYMILVNFNFLSKKLLLRSEVHIGGWETKSKACWASASEY